MWLTLLLGTIIYMISLGLFMFPSHIAKSAIVLISNSSDNKVHDNNIMDSSSPLRIDPGLDQINTIYSNKIENSSTPSTSTDTSPPSPDTSYTSPPQ
jgi:hypothetical protein